MKIPLKAKVICKDGEYGSVKDLLIDPIKEKVTHIVIENKHKGVEVIVPVDIVNYSTDNVVTITETAAVLDEFPPFLVHQFIKVPASDTDYAYWGADPTMTHSYSMFPYVIHNGVPTIEITQESVPKGDLKLRKGMVVKNLHGKTVGHIDELIIDAESDFITHIVMRTGHMFGSRDVAVPNVNIGSFEAEGVVLTLDEKEIEALPEVIIKRAWTS